MQKIALAVSLAALALAAPAAHAAPAADKVVLVVKYVASPGREEEVAARFAKLAQVVAREEPGTTFIVYRSEKEPGAFVFYEVYGSRADFERHRDVVLARFRKDNPAPEGLFAGPPRVETLRELPR